MNIKEAKKQILNAIQAYLIKDEFGDYRISIEHQRPVFLLGAPGIGKTAIMEQIAQETGVNLVTYSMSHHTRESALGLPVIELRNRLVELRRVTCCNNYPTCRNLMKSENLILQELEHCRSKGLGNAVDLIEEENTLFDACYCT